MADKCPLIIIDAYEAVEDQQIGWFLVDDVPRGNRPQGVKVLITSREDVWITASAFEDSPPRKVKLGGLDTSQALRFLRTQAKELLEISGKEQCLRLDAVISADDATLEPLVKATSGNPKVLELTLGYIVEHGMQLTAAVNDLYAAAPSMEKLLDYIFRSAWRIPQTLHAAREIDTRI